MTKLHRQWARAFGPHCSQCQELNRLHSQCVDGNRIKIPDVLHNYPTPLPDAEHFILDVLHDDASKHCRETKAQAQAIDVADREILEHVLSNPSPFSSFELAKLTLAWCRIHHVPFEEFWTFFDPSQLTPEQQTWLLSELPPSAKYASFTKNGLLQSSILSLQDLQEFRLDYQAPHWKCVFESQSDPLRNLMTVVNQTFDRFAKKFLVLNLGERLSIALYFPKLLQREDDFVVDSTVRLFAFPHSHKDKTGHRRVVPTKKNYRFYYDDSIMQLYENRRSNTFVYLVRSAGDDSAYRDVKGKSNQARARQKAIDDGITCEWRVSIALQKFSDQLATQIGRTNREGVTSAVSFTVVASPCRFYSPPLHLMQLTASLRNYT